MKIRQIKKIILLIFKARLQYLSLLDKFRLLIYKNRLPNLRYLKKTFLWSNQKLARLLNYDLIKDQHKIKIFRQMQRPLYNQVRVRKVQHLCNIDLQIFNKALRKERRKKVKNKDLKSLLLKVNFRLQILKLFIRILLLMSKLDN